MEKTKIKVEIPVNVNSDFVTANITIVPGREPILAFVQLDFGFLTVKGITVKKVDFKHDGNESLIFDMPAYKAGFTYVKSIFISDKRIFTELAQTVIQKVEEALGGNVYTRKYSEEEVDPEDIPF